MYTINSKATTKIKKQGVKPTSERKWNHKKYLFTRRQNKRTQQMEQIEIKQQEDNLNLTVSIIILRVNGLNIPIKRQRYKI